MRLARAPRYLFHWTTASALRDFAAASGRIALVKRVPPESALYRCHPKLRGRPALYAWSHPITAMASNPELIYAGSRPSDARLLILEIKAGAAVLTLSSRRPCAEPRRGESVPGGTDLIFHRIRYANGTVVREWVLLNARAIANFTADTGALREFLRRESVRLLDPAYDYPEPFFHTRSRELNRAGAPYFLSISSYPPTRKSVILPRLKGVLKLRAEDIPPPMRRPLAIAPEVLRSYSP